MSVKLVLGCSQFRQSHLVSEGDADDAERVIILLEVFLKVIEGFVCDVCLGLFGLFHLLLQDYLYINKYDVSFKSINSCKQP